MTSRRNQLLKKLIGKGTGEDEAKLYKLTRQAMKLPRGSEAQRRVIDAMNPVRKALRLDPIAVTEAFVEPQFDVEWDEAARYPEFVAIGKDAWIELAKTGKPVTITDAGDIVWPDQQMMFYAQSILKKHPKESIVFDVSSGV